MTEKKVVKKTTKKAPPARAKTPKDYAVNFSVWSINGGPLPEEVVSKLETAIEAVTFEFFNEGHRLLTQTTRG